MWEEGEHALQETADTNNELAKLEGDLSTEEAQSALVRFLQANPYFSVNLLTGFEVYPFQDLVIRALFEKDFVLFVGGRGLSKSTLAGWYAMLYAIFNPNIRIGICSSNFRQARLLFQNIEKYAYSPKGGYLLQCLIPDKPCKHNPDAWEMHFSNGSVIVAVPLGAGDRIRGYRFNVMIIDELLLLTEKVINEVIGPFMAIQSDPVERQKVREAEDLLIAAGKLEEGDRYKFPSNKLIGLTSASYKFEYLYKLYTDYKDLIFDKRANNVSHCIMQFSYEIAPEGLYDEKNVKNAKKSSSSAQFAREYMAHFTDDSAGYFSAKKMEQATINSGDYPAVSLMGQKEKKYILGIDPNYDDAESSDHFAMCVLELDEDDDKCTVVHNYALSKSDIKSRSCYFNYILTCFNIVYVIFDKAGGKSFFNDLKTLDLLEKNISVFEHDFDNENKMEGALTSKAEYNENTGKIVHLQYFAPRWIREANELLQASIERKRVMFAAKPSEAQYQKLIKSKIPIMDLDFTDDGDESQKTPAIKMTDFIDRQSELVDLVKRECSLIEVTSTTTGHQRFDLPQSLARDKSSTRARKDSYSALLLALYGADCYRSMQGAKVAKKENSRFIPRFVA